MPKRVMVNITTRMNTKAIRREKRNGRDVVIAPSATLPDDVVMNGIMYPADEIASSYSTLSRTPAPFGHPMVNGNFVSAKDPEGLNVGYIGAWNENVRRENGRVLLDKVIDVDVANRTDNGKAVLNAIEKGDPVHTSTGLLCDLEKADGQEYKYIARNMLFDHDAILLNEEGAATPEQGVGMLVNAKGDLDEVEVINSVLEDAERDLEWAAEMASHAVERMERSTVIDRVKSAIKEAISGNSKREPSAVQGEAEMADKEQLEALSVRMNAIEETLGSIQESVTNAMNTVTEHVDRVAEEAKAAEEAERAELTNKVVKANLLDEEAAKAAPVETLRALAANIKSKKAAPIFNGVTSDQTENEWDGYSLNAHMQES